MLEYFILYAGCFACSIGAVVTRRLFDWGNTCNEILEDIEYSVAPIEVVQPALNNQMTNQQTNHQSGLQFGPQLLSMSIPTPPPVPPVLYIETNKFMKGKKLKQTDD